ncbi:MAG TPA: patatin-like phospholipase family protein [Polyangiaceae bacterium]|nr:patatin-like phospholipase family protein [Polyangiaceae bacterium]
MSPPSVRHSLPAPPGSRTGIVLSGGGARGAYQVGVVSGILEVLEDRGFSHTPFSVLCGTSVGAINAAYFAAHSDRSDLEIGGLENAWKSLKLSDHLRLNLRGLLGIWSARNFGEEETSSGKPIQARALLDSLPLHDLVKTQVPFERLHRNVDDGVVHALVIAALEIASGRTTLFAEAPPYVSFPPSNDPRRNVRRERIELEHVLASAALPLVFPPRRIAGVEYCDGGVRFNTPIAPAIRAGADRLVVISLLSESPHGEQAEIPVTVREASYKNPAFLLGKVLNALLLDPTHYDLQVLERLNHMIETLEKVLTREQLEAFHRTVYRERNMAYRKVSALVFRPSLDVGELAMNHARGMKAEGLGAKLLSRLAHQKTVWQSDLVSFLCFDGGFAEKLIRLGREDALRRDEEIRRFFEA